jgi:hypothetical protein
MILFPKYGKLLQLVFKKIMKTYQKKLVEFIHKLKKL